MKKVEAVKIESIISEMLAIHISGIEVSARSNTRVEPGQLGYNTLTESLLGTYALSRRR